MNEEALPDALEPALAAQVKAHIEKERRELQSTLADVQKEEQQPHNNGIYDAAVAVEEDLGEGSPSDTWTARELNDLHNIQLDAEGAPQQRASFEAKARAMLNDAPASLAAAKNALSVPAATGVQTR